MSIEVLYGEAEKGPGVIGLNTTDSQSDIVLSKGTLHHNTNVRNPCMYKCSSMTDVMTSLSLVAVVILACGYIMNNLA